MHLPFKSTILTLCLVLLSSCGLQQDAGYPHDDEPIVSARELYDGGHDLETAVRNFRNTHRHFPVRMVEAPASPSPLPVAARQLGEVEFMFGDSLHTMEDYLEGNRVAGFLVLHNGEIVHETYRHGNREDTRWMSMSVAKSVSSVLTGAALKQGYISDIDDPVNRYVPELEGTPYDGVTVRQVLTMTSGVEWDETYTDPRSDRRRLLEAQLSGERGAVLDVMKGLNRAAEPGTEFLYNTGESQIIAEVLSSATGKTLSDFLSESIWKPMGAEHEALWWLDAENGIEIAGSGLSATLRDYGRFGLFVLNNGRVNGNGNENRESLLPEGWMEQSSTPMVLPDGTEIDYGYAWWTGTIPAARQDGAFSADGIFGQTIYINPAANVVIVTLGAWPDPLESGVYDWDWGVFEAIADSLRRAE